ncbi:MAG TPA: SDR family oxidoreductase [Anaerolineae bacterium]|nr:SDR family oxidoreductase [Anaerolineae bacterium]
MRVLVTGNLGYIGTVLTPALVSAGYEVVGLDSGYYADCVLGELPNDYPGRFKQIYADVRDLEPDQLAGVEAIVHLAALSNDPTGELNPDLTAEINHRASVRLAQSARAAGVRRFIFSSSCSIYGQGESKTLTEAASFNPLTAYARSKVKAEAEIATLASDDFSPVFLRNATAYGLSPRLRFDLVVNNLTGWAYTTGHVRLMSNGESWRPLVHVNDIVNAFLATLTAPRGAIHNQAFNVGRDEDNYQIRYIADAVARVAPNCQVTFAEGASADSRTYHVGFAKIRERLPEFKLAWGVEQGIQQLYQAFEQVQLPYEDFEGRKYTRLKQLRYLLDTHQVDPNLRWNKVEALAAMN